ncbi:hypothetical protein B0H13DRAFT_2345320 [Mycena leptocephala]|nr:hypothetical protein B0H13DRAFT_2345320 [Mycena leptocephala]
MSIIDRLPSEVVVFFFIVACRPFAFDWKRFNDMRATLRLVCRRWCLIADSCQDIWTALPISIITTSEYINFVLDRAGKAELAVYFHLLAMPTKQGRIDVGPATIQSFCHRIQHSLMPAIEQVRDLTMRCARAEQWKFVRDTLKIDADGNIRSLSLYVAPPYHGTHMLPDQVTTVQDSAVLENLRLFGTFGVWSGHPTFPKLTTLRLLRYTQVSWSTLTAALGSAKCLELLEMQGVQLTDPDSVPRSKALVLGNVGTIVVSVNSRTMVDVMGKLSFPALTTMEVNLDEEHIKEFAHNNGDDLARAQHISLSIGMISRSAADALLRCIRDAVTLDVGPLTPWGVSPIMDILKEGLSLPNLKELEIGSIAIASDIAAIYGLADTARFAKGCVVFTSNHNQMDYNCDRWTWSGTDCLRERVWRRSALDAPGSRWVRGDLYTYIV